MGDIGKYHCDYCNRDFWQKVGVGKIQRQPIQEPKTCQYCSSEKIRRTGKVGNWD